MGYPVQTGKGLSKLSRVEFTKASIMEVTGVSTVPAANLYVDNPAGVRPTGGQSDAPAAAAESSTAGTSAQADSSNETPTDTVTLGSQSKLTDEQLAELAKLRARDLQVRQHEMAHLAASGGLATSGASFTYQKGPDGVSYAVGGEVHIDTSPGRTPEDTIAKARTIQAAALAPADPSGQDRQVAAAAMQMELQARAELAQQAVQQAKGVNGKQAGEPAEPTGKVQSAQSIQAYEAVAATVQSGGSAAASGGRGVDLYA